MTITSTLSPSLSGWAIALGIGVMFLVAAPALLLVIYHHGAASLGRWPLTSYAQWQFGELADLLHTSPKPSGWSAAGIGSGAAIMLFLIRVHQRFLWWGLSPIGYIIASSYETNRSLWANAILGYRPTVSLEEGLRRTWASLEAPAPRVAVRS